MTQRKAEMGRRLQRRDAKEEEEEEEDEKKYIPKQQPSRRSITGPERGWDPALTSIA
jgi:hypothetical protein